MKGSGRGVAWLCISVGVAGYLLLVGLPALAPGASVGDALAGLSRLAPVWLVLWLLAGVGIRVRTHWRGRRLGEVSTDRGAATPHCSRCGAEMELRRRRDGPHRGQPYWNCARHGEPPR